VEFEGKTLPLASLAEARDHVRAAHLALDPYPLVDIEVNEFRGMPRGGFQIKGHASVFNRTSLDLGGFREQVMPGFFQPVLDLNPDVHAVWDHDTRWVLGRTVNDTLELREDDVGLFNWMQVAPTSYASDLRILMQRGDIDQESFAFEVGEDEWFQDEAGNVMRHLVQASALYDVTITAKGAYPQTDATVARAMRSVLQTDRVIVPVSVDIGAAGAIEPAADQRAESRETEDGSESQATVTELRHLIAVRKDEIAAFKERSARL
jgi:uncharacterized protein